MNCNSSLLRSFALAALIAGMLVWPLVCDAQAGGATDKIRATAARLDEARKLLNDSSANVRLAAFDEYSRSGDAAVRELAFEEGFASADATMRSLALRGRIAASKTLALELVNSKKLPEEEWKLFIQRNFRSGRIVFQNVVLDATTGAITFHGGSGRLAGQDLSMSWGAYVLRMRLGDAAVMDGSLSHHTNVSAARLALQ
jgi:hypothetical protein